MTRFAPALAALAALGLATPALAQSAAPAGGCGPMGGLAGEFGMMPGGMAGLNADAIAKAKSEIGITAQQEPQWSAFTDAVKASVDNASQLHQSMDPARMYQMNSSEMQSFMQGVQASRQQSLASVGDARTRLFDVLTADQKTKATALLGSGIGAGAMGGGPAMMGGYGAMLRR